MILKLAYATHEMQLFIQNESISLLEWNLTYYAFIDIISAFLSSFIQKSKHLNRKGKKRSDYNDEYEIGTNV